jgi:hypothetical protein
MALRSGERLSAGPSLDDRRRAECDATSQTASIAAAKPAAKA